MLFDGVKSAEPPRNSGSNGAKPFNAFPEATREESDSACSLTDAINLSASSVKLAGRSPAVRRRNSAASVGKAALYASNFSFHSASAFAPASFASHPA